MPRITDEIRKEVKDIVYNFFAEECEVDLNRISSNTKIIKELGGDEQRWKTLLQELAEKRREETTIKGFLVALSHSCLYHAEAGRVPDFVLPALENLAFGEHALPTAA